MANGDKAAAAGLDILDPQVDKPVNGADEINKTRDYIADVMESGTELPLDRIPEIPLTGKTSGNLAGSRVSGAVSRAAGTDGAHAAEVSGAGPYYSVWVDGTRNFRRNTSSRRYKKNIKRYNFDLTKLRQLQVKKYDRRNGVSGEVGLIAEEVHELLPELVTMWWPTDEQGNPTGDKQVDGVRYDLLALPLLQLVIQLADRVEALEAERGEK